MIKIENVKVEGFEPAIRGMRNPMNSWEKSDSYDAVDCGKCGKIDREGFCRKEDSDCRGFECYAVGPNDLDLMKRLAAGGPVHAKYRRMIVVWVDITAPLYWWKEFKTYRAGRVFGDQEPEIISDYLEYDIEMNSCSTMHKIHAKEFELEDFSHEHIIDFFEVTDTSKYMDDKNNYNFDDHPVIVLGDGDHFVSPAGILMFTIRMLNKCRKLYLETKDKKYWWQMIQLLPSSYNQKRTVILNYEVLHNIYNSRKDHKLDEWRDFCKWIESLPYSEVITNECKN